MPPPVHILRQVWVGFDGRRTTKLHTQRRLGMGCGASSSAKPLVVNPPARAETAKARLEELKKPRPGAPALSGSTSGLGQKSERNLLATSTTPAVKKYALSEDFHKPRERSVSVRKSNR